MDTLGQEQLRLTTASRAGEPLSAQASGTFPFMSLPLELRLKIYEYLFPARTHTIVAQLPNSGYFRKTPTGLQRLAQSSYPFGTKTPDKTTTTYRVLNKKFSSSFPDPPLYPEILRVSRQVRDEAEPVLYGSSEAVWDFGIHLEALKAFFGDRSEVARRSVRNVRIAREIPCSKIGDGLVSKEVDPSWVAMCELLKSELVNLWTLDLMIWSSSGSVSFFPFSSSSSSSSSSSTVTADLAALDLCASDTGEEHSEEREKAKEEETKRWREWEWTHDLLKMETLRKAKITWWEFQSIGRSGPNSFYSWFAHRMVRDQSARDRMIREGVAIEGTVVLPALGA